MVLRRSGETKKIFQQYVQITTCTQTVQQIYTDPTLNMSMVLVVHMPSLYGVLCPPNSNILTSEEFALEVR